MIDKQTEERIKQAVRIEEVVSDFIQLHPSGRKNLLALCPFHTENTPSFFVTPEAGFYHCFGCGAGGDAIDFLRRHKGMDYPTALRWLAKKYGIEVKEEDEAGESSSPTLTPQERMLLVAARYYAEVLPMGAQAMPYLDKRGITRESIIRYGLGLSPNDSRLIHRLHNEGFTDEEIRAAGLGAPNVNGILYPTFRYRIIFPFLRGKKVIGFAARMPHEVNHGGEPKYINSQQSDIFVKGNELWGLPQALPEIRRNGTVTLVEGYMDVIQLDQKGVKNAVASCGTALTEAQARTLAQVAKRVDVAYDGDKAGKEAALRAIDMLLPLGVTVRVIPWPKDEDPDSFAFKHSAGELEEHIDSKRMDWMDFAWQALVTRTTSMEARIEAVQRLQRSIDLMPNDLTRTLYSTTLRNRVS